MKKKTNISRQNALNCLDAIIVMLVVSGLLLLGITHVSNPIPTHTIKPYPIESLNQIIPGQTNLRDALTILGEPDSVEDPSYHPTRLVENIFKRLPDYKVYIFLDAQGWRYTELWLQKMGLNQVVVAVLRFLPIEKLGDANRPFLDDFVIAYGHPDEVLWSSYCFSRYLIWSNEGVAVDAASGPFIFEQGIRRSLSWSERGIKTVFLFEPMDIKDIIDISQWPWPNNGTGWNLSSMCKDDHDPKDPFDWKSLPTPSP